jgi:hypothetical protein
MKHELIDALVQDLKDIYQRMIQFAKTTPFSTSNIGRPLFLIIITLALVPLLAFLLLISLSEVSIVA